MSTQQDSNKIAHNFNGEKSAGKKVYKKKSEDKLVYVDA